MKVLVFGHHLEIGGTQSNAIELAATLRDDHGFDIVYFASPGPMLRHLEEKRMRYLPAPDIRFHPSWTRMKALSAIIRQEKPDLIHAWDWWQGLEAYFGPYLSMHQPLLVSDMMMSLTRVLPRHLPTTFGTPNLHRRATELGWKRAELLLPPIDTTINAPGAADGRDLRMNLGLRKHEVLLVSVSRLAGEMKSAPLRRLISAVRRLGTPTPVKLLVVGDGRDRKKVEAMAESVNRELGASAIVFAGPMIDPRTAYSAVDVVIGMGGSSLKGLAFTKPVIVVGSRGFARIFSPETSAGFLTSGMYGEGHEESEEDPLAYALRQLVEDEPLS